MPPTTTMPASLDTLLTSGQRGTILDISGDDAIAVRLMEMGFTEGEQVELIGRAPLGDPIEYRVRGYRVSLRASEARRIVIEPAQP